MDKIWKAYMALPGWAKAVIAIIILLVLIWSGNQIRKAIKSARDNRDINEKKDDLDKSSNKALEDLADQGVNPTMTDIEAETLCNTIQQLLDGCELSGSEKQVVDQILAAVDNQADWVLLQQTFGVREIDNCGPFTGVSNVGLKDLLSDQLDSIDWGFTTYITNLKQGLTAKNITF